MPTATVKDVRELFKNLLQRGIYTENKNKTGSKTVELINACFIADEPTIFGKVNEDWVTRESQWYHSQSLNVNDIPGGPPKIWTMVATPDGYINSNYGWCLFSPDNYSQFLACAQQLKDDEFSRRAIMIYTRPSMQVEYNKGGMSDFMCFSGETLVLSPEGDLPIKEVIEQIKINGKYPVYSVNFTTGIREIKWAIAGSCTGTKQIVRVYFDNGKFIDTTENHIFYVKQKYVSSDRLTQPVIYDIEVKAKDLKPGMSCVSSLIYKQGNGGYQRYKTTLSGEFNYSNGTIVHRNYYEFRTESKIPEGFEIHHKDENPSNNKFDNLELIEKSNHRKVHMNGKNNSVFKISNRTEQLSKMVNTLKETCSKRDISDYEIKIGLTIETLQQHISNFVSSVEKPSERKYEKFCREKNLQKYLTLLGHFKRLFSLTFSEIAFQNCKISKIEYLDTQEVFDITVEDNHNFFVGWNNEYGIGNGVLVHNCTNTVQYFIRNDQLISCVSMRSNDGWAGYRGDLYWQKEIQSLLFKELRDIYPNLTIGPIIWNAGSLHIYERQFYLIENYAKTGNLHITKEEWLKTKN